MENMEACSWVWSWGAGTRGQLGSGDFSDRLEPLRLTSFFENVGALSAGDSGGVPTTVTVAGGGAHAVALLGSKDNAQVMSWGNGESGALGHGDQSDLCLPKSVSCFQKIQICCVSAGWNHTAFVTRAGDLYTCGAGSFGQLGHGDLEARLTPTHVQSLSGKPVSLAACGMRHTIVLQGSSEGHAVYAFGSSRRGQLGIGRSIQNNVPHSGKISFPKRVVGIGEQNIMRIFANGDHSAALTDRGRLYIWGRGFGSTPDLPIPAEVCCELCFSDVALGWNHCIALAGGQLWAWGSNDKGQLGAPSGLKPSSSLSSGSPSRCLDSKSSEIDEREEGHTSGTASEEQTFGARHVVLVCRESPNSSDVGSTGEGNTPEKHTMRICRVAGLEGKVVKALSAGAEHSAIILEDGSFMTWGWGEHGQLGHRDDADQPYPISVAFPSADVNGIFEWRAFCGSGFTFAVAKKKVAFENEP